MYPASLIHPPVVTLIDRHSLELVKPQWPNGGYVYHAIKRGLLSLTGYLLPPPGPNVSFIEQYNITYIILDYSPDHDLFTCNCKGLGNNKLIRHIFFLKMLEAVEYCHILVIYHRDLKLKNVLWFDGDKMTDEFRTGSMYHMSPNHFLISISVWYVANGPIDYRMTRGRVCPSDATASALIREMAI